MLDFHIGTGGIENPGEYLGSLAIDEILWLRKNGFLVEGDIGQNGDLAETLSYFAIDLMKQSRPQVLVQVQLTNWTRYLAERSR